MDFAFLSKTGVFQGISPQELPALLQSVRAEEKNFPKGSVIYRAGETVSAMGLILSGRVCIENDDIWGNKSILGTASAGQVFAESYACIPSEPIMVSVIAEEETSILFLHMGRLLQACTAASPLHIRIMQNLFFAAVQKNLNLSRRIFHTSAKSIRGRLLSYLSAQAMQEGSSDFYIPFNRQQLADYLSVDRSALSNELSKMQKEGMLTVKRNHFTLTSNTLKFSLS